MKLKDGGTIRYAPIFPAWAPSSLPEGMEDRF
jgi:hypothetical protein